MYGPLGKTDKVTIFCLMVRSASVVWRRLYDALWRCPRRLLSQYFSVKRAYTMAEIFEKWSGSIGFCSQCVSSKISFYSQCIFQNDALWRCPRQLLPRQLLPRQLLEQFFSIKRAYTMVLTNKNETPNWFDASFYTLYSREQKHVLLFRKSEILLFKVWISNMPHIF